MLISKEIQKNNRIKYIIDRNWLYRKYVVERKSIRDIADEIKKVTGIQIGAMTVWKRLYEYRIPRRNKHEANLKYKRIKFPNLNNINNVKFEYSRVIADKNYILGFCIGDAGIIPESPYAIKIVLSTTHPSMVECFVRIFEPYGHIHIMPKKGKQNNYYVTQYIYLDRKSFSFLLKQYHILGMNDLEFYAFLAGFTDADGGLRLYPTGRKCQFNYYLSQKNMNLLEAIARRLEKDGFHPVIDINNGISRLFLKRNIEVVKIALKLLKYSRHPEKIASIKYILKAHSLGRKWWLIEKDWSRFLTNIKESKEEFATIISKYFYFRKKNFSEIIIKETHNLSEKIENVAFNSSDIKQPSLDIYNLSIPESIVKKVLDLRWQGLSIYEISDKTGLSVNNTRIILFVANDPKGLVGATVSNELLDEIVRKYEKGYSMEKLSKEYHLSKYTVKAYLYKRQIKPRSRQEQLILSKKPKYNKSSLL